MPLLNQYLVIALGGALGSMLRFGLGTWIDSHVQRGGSAFSWGTILVNITGCFIIGFIWTLSAPDGRIILSTYTRSFILIGILGGYTTFSSFGLQTFLLAQAGQRGDAMLNVLVSLVVCLAGVWLGAMLAGWINQPR